MATVHDLTGGWQAIEIKGRGVLVGNGMGVAFVEGVGIENGELIDLGVSPASYPADAPPVPVEKPVFDSVSSDNIAALLKDLNGKNLTESGDYGGVGPVMKKFVEAMKTLHPESPIRVSLGDFLATGDHARHGTAAAIVGLSGEKLAEFSALLDGSDAIAFEVFAEKQIAG